MTLDELADKLRSQAKNGSIVLSTAILPQTDVDKIAAAFMLGHAGRFEVTGISARDITATSAGEVRVFAGRTSVLGQKTAAAGLTFTVDEKGAVQYLVSAEMSADWALASSFHSLSGYPFNQLGLSRTYFLYSSVDKAIYSPWSDAHSCSLAVGLNVLSQVSIKSADGALGLVKELLGSGTLYTASGTIAPDDRYRYPAMRLTLEPDAKRVAIIDGFSIDHPALRVTISEPRDSRQTIGLTLTASALDLLDISVEMSAAESSLTFKATALKGKVVDATAIASLPFAKDFRTSIPQDLADGFRNVTLGVFAMTLIQGRTVGMVAITLKTPDDFRFEIVKDVLTLEGIALTLIFWGGETTVSVGAQCQLFPKRDLFPGIFGFTLTVDVANGKAELAEIAGRYYGKDGDDSGSIELPRIVSAIAGEQIQLPPALENLSFSDFGVSGRKIPGQGYSWTLYGHCKDAFPVCGHPVSAALAVQATFAKGSYDIDLVGTLAIGEQHFVSELKLAKSQGGDGGTALLSAAVERRGNRLSELHLDRRHVRLEAGHTDGARSRVERGVADLRLHRRDSGADGRYESEKEGRVRRRPRRSELADVSCGRDRCSAQCDVRGYPGGGKQVSRRRAGRDSGCRRVGAVRPGRAVFRGRQGQQPDRFGIPASPGC